MNQFKKKGVLAALGVTAGIVFWPASLSAMDIADSSSRQGGMPGAKTRMMDGSPLLSQDGSREQALMQEIEWLKLELELLKKEMTLLKEEISRLRENLSSAKGAAAPAIDPAFVRDLTANAPGFNHSNPTWSTNGKVLGFERSEQRKKEIIIADPEGGVVKTIAYRSAEDDMGLGVLLPGFSDSVKYNAGLSWSPEGGRFVFMSNGEEGNYDLYLGTVDSEQMERLTDHPEKEGQAHWSPAGDDIVFVSGREGSAQIYHLDLGTRKVRRISEGDKSHLYPQWSPDGKRVAFIYGSNQNHDVFVINDLNDPRGSLKPLTSWLYDDLRPKWSPDGTKLAFYTNYNEEGDPKRWSIVVVEASGSDGVEEDDLTSQVVATNVVPDIERGPAWLPDSRRIAYVKNEREHYNPIYVADIETRTNRRLATQTKINHDVSCSPQGLIAFRAQVDQWDQIFVTALKDGEG